MYNNPYFNPYINNMNMVNPSMMMRPKGTFFKSLTNIKWSDILNNTQKTLNVINQAIPVYYQIKPIFSNIRSLGRLVTAFNENDNNYNQNIEKKESNSNSPTFFMN